MAAADPQTLLPSIFDHSTQENRCQLSCRCAAPDTMKMGYSANDARIHVTLFSGMDVLEVLGVVPY